MAIQGHMNNKEEKKEREKNTALLSTIQKSFMVVLFAKLQPQSEMKSFVWPLSIIITNIDFLGSAKIFLKIYVAASLALNNQTRQVVKQMSHKCWHNSLNYTIRLHWKAWLTIMLLLQSFKLLFKFVFTYPHAQTTTKLADSFSSSSL